MDFMSEFYSPSFVVKPVLTFYSTCLTSIFSSPLMYLRPDFKSPVERKMIL
jgi:hypothetical protein